LVSLSLLGPPLEDGVEHLFRARGLISEWAQFGIKPAHKMEIEVGSLRWMTI
jgi:hypothetical protein